MVVAQNVLSERWLTEEKPRQELGSDSPPVHFGVPGPQCDGSPSLSTPGSPRVLPVIEVWGAVPCIGMHWSEPVLGRSSSPADALEAVLPLGCLTRSPGC